MVLSTWPSFGIRLLEMLHAESQIQKGGRLADKTSLHCVCKHPGCFDRSVPVARLRNLPPRNHTLLLARVAHMERHSMTSYLRVRLHLDVLSNKFVSFLHLCRSWLVFFSCLSSNEEVSSKRSSHVPIPLLLHNGDVSRRNRRCVG